MNRQTDLRHRKRSSLTRSQPAKSNPVRSRKKRRLIALFKILLMSSSLLLSLLIIQLLRVTVSHLAQDKADSMSLAGNFLSDQGVLKSSRASGKSKNSADAESGSRNGGTEHANSGSADSSITDTSNTDSSRNHTAGTDSSGNHTAGTDSSPENSANADTSSASRTDSGGRKTSSKNQNADAASRLTEDTTLVFAGDVYLSDYVLAAYGQSGINGVLSESMLKELTQADIAIVNNEFPYSTRGTQAPDKQFTFRVDPSYVNVLSDAGVDLVTLANNHVLDYGTDALTDTFQTLDDAKIDYAGAGNSLKRASKLITKKANGYTFGFLAASRVFPVISWNVENAQPGVFSAYDPSKLISAVKDAAGRCDYLCVYVHWGIERNTTPEEYQVSMAHALIDAGADAVIGAHPHVLQGVEYYKGKPIFYSLGNFIFYQTIEQTAIAKLTFSPDQTARWQLLPAGAANSRTYLVTDDAQQQTFYEYMSGLSINAGFADDGTISPKS